MRQSRASWPLILTLSSVAVATLLALRIGAPPAATPVGAPAIDDLSRGRAPRWLHEGLAQLLEGVPADAALRGRGAVTLDALETLLADPDPGRARAGYDLALWIVHDLAARGETPSLRALLDRMATGEPLSGSLIRVYGSRLAELQSQWLHLLNG